MAFDDIEASEDAGRPIALYQFTLGSTVWRYTGGSRDKLYAGNIFKSVAISDDGAKQTGEATSDALTILAPSTTGPAQAHSGGSPSSTIQVVIFLLHEETSFSAPVYVGEITQVDFQTPGTVRIICLTQSASMQRDGLRLTWQRSCPYSLYDPSTCRVNPNAYKVTALITDVTDGMVVSSAFAAQPDDYYSGGFVQWMHPVRGMEYRGITTHAGSTLTIFGSMDGLYPGLTLEVFPGCKRTSADCINKFGNYLNYGGIPNLPGKSPFDGNPVF